MHKTFKHGDKVRATIWDVDVEGKISIDEAGTPYVCHNEGNANGATADDKLGYKYSWVLNDYFIGRGVKNLRLAEPEPEPITWENLEVGDIIQSKSGKILEIIDPKTVIFIKHKDGEVSTAQKEELQKAGYTIDQTDTSITLEEAEKRLGVKD